MKVIFLDVDGVLNSNRTLYCDDSIELDLVENLATIVRATDARIVLTSTWRLVPEALRVLMDTFMKFNLAISSYTSELCNRTEEILCWLKTHQDFQVNKFVILDDEDKDIKNWFPDELVKTDFMKGLTKEDAAKAIKLLS